MLNAEVRTPLAEIDSRRRILVSGRSFVVFQIYYDLNSKMALRPEYNSYFNGKMTRYAENSIIADLLEREQHRDCDYFGIFSWRFHTKVPLTPGEMFARIEADQFGSDVYSFFGAPEIQAPLIWEQTEVYHPGITRIATRLFRELGLSLRLEEVRSASVYENHFLCRPELYERYYREMLKPLLHLMENVSDPELKNRLFGDANYHRRSATVLTPTQIEAIFDRPHFTFHPFICERLFSTWLYLNPQIRVRHVWEKRSLS